MKTVFQRHEIKYMITLQQKEEILSVMKPFMRLDNYGHITVRNLYFDTDSFQLIRRSIEKPVYKEKLRLRSYELVTYDNKVFLELKKKYNKVVYKRRIAISERDVLIAFNNDSSLPINSQIASEIDYFRSYYKILKPKVFLSYEREAFYSIDNSDLRITFDNNILYRLNDLSLTSPPYGTKILNDENILMEIKTSEAMPLWLTNKLTNMKIFNTSFSKYGKVYEDILKKGEGMGNYGKFI